MEESEKTCKTCVSHNGMESEYMVDCLDGFAKPTLGVEQAVDCDSYVVKKDKEKKILGLASRHKRIFRMGSQVKVTPRNDRCIMQGWFRGGFF